VLSPESTIVSNVKGDIIPTQIIDNEKIPLEITKKGWIFDPEEGQKIQGKYIFGQDTTINKNELKFSLGDDLFGYDLDESTIVVIIISTVAIAAALFYLKGYKK
jgi:hypothetical protein